MGHPTQALDAHRLRRHALPDVDPRVPDDAQMGAVPAALEESRAFAATGNTALEFMVIGIARDFETKKAYMLTEENRVRTGPR